MPSPNSLHLLHTPRASAVAGSTGSLEQNTRHKTFSEGQEDMSDIFITSDEHSGHEKIITYVNRPFTSVEEQTETLIERHNKKVPNKKSYLTIHAGDLFWETMGETEAIQIIRRLNGRHAFLYGNHDDLMERSMNLRSQFEWVRGMN